MVRDYRTTQRARSRKFSSNAGFPGYPRRRFDMKMGDGSRTIRGLGFPPGRPKHGPVRILVSGGRRQSLPLGIRPPSRGRCGRWGDSHVVRLTPLYRMQFTGIQGVGPHGRRFAHCLLTRAVLRQAFAVSVERSASSIRAGMGLRTRHVGHDVLTKKLKEPSATPSAAGSSRLRHPRLDGCRGAAQ